MKPGWLLALGILGGLLGAGVLALLASPPRGEPVTLQPAPGPAAMLVHVTGAVAQPGLVSLPAHSRVQDAIQAAGGATDDADMQSLNLAAEVSDGQRVWVPWQQAVEVQNTTGSASSGALPAVNPASPTLPGPLLVEINTADQAGLEALPGIGPVMAQAILDFRAANGPFQSAEQLLDVKGIGPATLEKLRPYLLINGVPAVTPMP